MRVLVITLLLISSHVSALTIDWIPLETAEKSGNPLHINGNAILKYKNAGHDGIESKISGDGSDRDTYGMYQTGNKILLTAGADSLAHSLRMVQFDPHNPNSVQGDVAIFGGAAFNTLAAAIPEPETYAMLLAGLGLLSLVACQKKRNV